MSEKSYEEGANQLGKVTVIYPDGTRMEIGQFIFAASGVTTYNEDGEIIHTTDYDKMTGGIHGPFSHDDLMAMFALIKNKIHEHLRQYL